MGGDRNGNRFPLTPGGEKKKPTGKKAIIYSPYKLTLRCQC